MINVTAAIIERNGKILIAKSSANGSLPNKWEFPGGTVEKNETPQACLKREMQEEFGINISVGTILGESIYHYDHGSIKLMAYRAYWESGKIVLNDHADYRWVSAKQLVEYNFAPADIPFVEKLI